MREITWKTRGRQLQKCSARATPSCGFWTKDPWPRWPSRLWLRFCSWALPCFLTNSYCHIVSKIWRKEEFNIEKARSRWEGAFTQRWVVHTERIFHIEIEPDIRTEMFLFFRLLGPNLFSEHFSGEFILVSFSFPFFVAHFWSCAFWTMRRSTRLSGVDYFFDQEKQLTNFRWPQKDRTRLPGESSAWFSINPGEIVMLPSKSIWYFHDRSIFDTPFRLAVFILQRDILLVWKKNVLWQDGKPLLEELPTEPWHIPEAPRSLCKRLGLWTF